MISLFFPLTKKHAEALNRGEDGGPLAPKEKPFLIPVLVAVLLSGVVGYVAGRVMAEPVWTWRMELAEDRMTPPPRPELPEQAVLTGQE